MTEPNFSVNFTAATLATDAPVAVKDLLVFDSALGVWRTATTANRTAANAGSQAIALTAHGGAVIGSVGYQSSGVLATSISGLLPGAKQLVRTSATGRIERIASFTAGDDVIGYAEADGRVHLHFGLPWAQILVVAGIPGAPDLSVQYRATSSSFGGATGASIHDNNLCLGTAVDAIPNSGQLRFLDTTWKITARDQNGIKKAIFEWEDVLPAPYTGGVLYIGRDATYSSATERGPFAISMQGGMEMLIGIERYPCLDLSSHHVGIHYTSGPGAVVDGTNIAPNVTDSRSTWNFGRWVNVAFLGGGKEYVTQGETLSRGDGVFFFGQAAINPDPAHPPTLGSVIYCDASKSFDLYYLRPDATVVPMFCPQASFLTLGTNSVLSNERVLTAGTNISFVDGGAGSTLTINASGGSGEVNTASNLGGGAQVFKSKVGVDLQFRSLIFTGGLGVVSNANDLTVTVSNPWTPPTGSGFVTVTGGALNAASLATISDVHVNASAAIAASKLAPPGATTQVIFNDAGAFAADAGMTYNKTTDALTLAGSLTVTSSLTADATSIKSAVPRHGNSTAFSSEGYVQITTAGTLNSSQYSRSFIEAALGTGVSGTLTFPHPASSDASYMKWGKNTSTSSAATYSTGTGTTVALNNVITTWQALFFTTAGVAL